MGGTNPELVEDSEGFVHDENVSIPMDADPEASEAVPDQLSYPTSLPTQVAFIDKNEERFPPLNTITGANQIQFMIPSYLNRVIDPSSVRALIRCKIVSQNGANIALVDNQGAHVANSQVLPVNGLGYALFEDITVKINDTIITDQDRMYAYRGDLNTRLLNNKAVKDSRLDLEGFIEEGDAFDDVDDADALTWDAENGMPVGADGDKAWAERWAKSRGSKSMYLKARIHSEIFDQPKCLPPSTKLFISFHLQSKPSFCIMTHRQQTYKIIIENMELSVKYKDVDLDIVEQVQTHSETSSHLFPIRRVIMDSHTKMQNTTDLSQYNLIPHGNNLPRRIFVCFVKQTAREGNKGQDPFNYLDVGIGRIGLKVGGQFKPLPELNSRADDDVVELVDSLLQATGANDNPIEDLGINTRNFRKRNYIIGWDLTPSDLPPGEAFELPQSKSLDLCVHLRANLAHTVNMIIYYEYDAEIEIDAKGNVHKKTFGTAP